MTAYDVEVDEVQPRPRGRRRPQPRRGSGWKTFAIVAGVLLGGLVSLVVGAVVLVAVFGEGYGKKIALNNGSELYYTKAVSADEANRLADYLNAKDVIVGQQDMKASFQLNKADDRYQFRMVMKDEAVGNPQIGMWLRVWAILASKDVFNGAPVDVHICDDRFQTREVLAFGGK